MATASVGLASPAEGAPPDGPSIVVEVHQCTNLDTSRVRALYALELGRAAERLGAETIAVTCGSSDTRLRVESSRMGWIERVLRTPLAREEAERIVALAAAQLVFAAWVEAPRERPASPDASTPAAQEAPAPSPKTQPVTALDVEVDVGIHTRPLGKLAMGPAFGLSGTAWRGVWGVLLGIGVDRVTSARTLGNVELMVGELELAPLWRSSSEEPVSFELSAGPALALVQLRGIEPLAASVRAAAISAVTLDAKARAALRYRGRGFSLRAAVDGGYLMSSVEGIISTDATIVARGGWVGFTVGGGATW